MIVLALKKKAIWLTTYLSLLTVIILWGLATPVLAAPSYTVDHWYIRNNSGNTLNGVTSGNGIILAIGVNGTILGSTDGGETWAARNSQVSLSLNGITYGNGTFVVIGAGGTILTSTDGVSWAPRYSGTDQDLYGVTYGNEAFVVVGKGGTILTSSDGAKTWNIRDSGTSKTLYAVAYGNHVFSTVGDRCTGFSTTDGYTWTVKSNEDLILYGIDYFNGSWTAVGGSDTHRVYLIMHSSNGIEWYYDDYNVADGKVAFHGVAYTDGNKDEIGNKAIIVGWDGNIRSSETGSKPWSICASPTKNLLNGVIFVNNTFVAVGGSGTIIQSEAPPTVTSIYPTSGTTNGGTQVMITGHGFIGATKVNFGTPTGTGLTINSDTWITVSSPAGNGTVDVTVTGPGGTSETNASDEFTYYPPPFVASLSPSSGPSDGGTTVTIKGFGFIDATAVKFGNALATNYKVNDDTSITAISPEGTGTVDVTVTGPGGISATSAGNEFTYIGKTVSNVATLGDINVSNGTTLANVGLPSTVQVTLSDNSKTNIGVTWDSGTPSYNATTAGTYAFKGILKMPTGLTNPTNVTATVHVIVEKPISLKGDINGDGAVNILDVVQAVNFALGKATPTTVQFTAADMNGEGIINILDVVQIVNKALGR